MPRPADLPGAVIQEADIQFRPGFNALTGETGAGKSIVIDAMGAVLGGRTSRDLIRTGADRAFVSAEFSQVPDGLPGLEETGAAPDEDGHLLLQRELTGDGKNLCRVNGRPVTVAQLRRIGEELLNIHGQHDGQQLLDEEQHLSYLDRFGRTEVPLGRYQAAYEAMADLQTKIRALQMDEAEKARRMDSLRFQIGELERAQLVPGEEESLTERRDLLRNGAGPAAQRGEVPLRPVRGGLLPERRGGGRRRRLRPSGRGGGRLRHPHPLRRHGRAVPAPGTAAV